MDTIWIRLIETNAKSNHSTGGMGGIGLKVKAESIIFTLAGSSELVFGQNIIA